jgi:Uma2 family endonuclease
LRDALRVQSGGGFMIDDHTYLGPDLMVLRQTAEPKEWTADDVVILIEIAWTSLSFDLGNKARRYAGAGIAEYWVIDVADQALIVHRDPTGTHYGAVSTLRPPATVAAALMPTLTVPVGALFG